MIGAHAARRLVGARCGRGVLRKLQSPPALLKSNLATVPRRARAHRTKDEEPMVGWFQHKGVRLAAAGWTFFIAENFVMSENREWIIASYSDSAYHACYNFLSTAACGSVAWGYFQYGKLQGPLMYRKTAKVPKTIAGVVSWLCMGLGLVAFSQFAPALRGYSSAPENEEQQTPSFSPPDGRPESSDLAKSLCPMDFEVERRYNEKYEHNEDAFFGLERITRHPSLYSFAFCSLGWALRTPFLTHFCTFAGPFFAIVALSQHKDSRFRRGLGGHLEADKDWPASSNFPFAAALFGEQREKVFSQSFWQNEMKHNNALVAFVVACIL